MRFDAVIKRLLVPSTHVAGEPGWGYAWQARHRQMSTRVGPIARKGGTGAPSGVVMGMDVRVDARGACFAADGLINDSGANLVNHVPTIGTVLSPESTCTGNT